MKFLNLASKALRNIKSNKNNSTSDEVGNIIENKGSKFPMWILGGGLGGLMFAVAASFIVIIAVLIYLGIIDISSISGNNGSCVNLPAIDSVCESITVEGYGTMSVDEYVAGVVKAEVGGMTDDNFNTYKSLAVAARSYALANATKDGNGNCFVPEGPTFQAYLSNPDANMLTAANDTTGIVLVKDNRIMSTQYDALCIESEDDKNYYLCQGGESEKNLTLPKDWLLERRTQGYIDETRLAVHGNGLSQNGAWYLALEKGWDYTKILEYFYGDEGITLASINGVTGNCSSSNNGDFKPLESYNLGGAGLQPLTKTLSESEQNELNDYINKEIDKAGFGTGAGVAAAGQALTYWLEQKGYYLRYYWGGGHGADARTVGVYPGWGKNVGYAYTEPSHRPTGPEYGMDCSGFTSWATRTACKPSGFNDLAGYWVQRGPSISLKDAKPGDILDSANHIKLVIKNNGDGSVIAAEESFGAGGLVFSLVDYLEPGYYVVDMSEWYSKNCASSR